MPSKNPSQRLRDIIENIDAIHGFIAAMPFDDFVRDRKTVYAVTRALEIVSEATRRLPEAVPSDRLGSGGSGRECLPARI
jgi:uncharacterized protein with HEPN domain